MNLSRKESWPPCSGSQAGDSGLTGLRILLPRARQARDLLPDTLTKMGARIDTVACYENVLPEI